MFFYNNIDIINKGLNFILDIISLDISIKYWITLSYDGIILFNVYILKLVWAHLCFITIIMNVKRAHIKRKINNSIYLRGLGFILGHVKKLVSFTNTLFLDANINEDLNFVIYWQNQKAATSWYKIWIKYQNFKLYLKNYYHEISLKSYL